MTGIEIREAIAVQRLDLAAVLTGLSPQMWEAESLCVGWRVREVVAHLTMPFRYSLPRFTGEIVKARGNFNKMADRCARGDAASMSAGELAAALRDNVRHPWKPPGGGYAGALTHDMIHGLDITVPLGIDRQIPEDRLRIVLQGAGTPKNIRYFGVDVRGIELRADDIDWTFGSGPTVSGTAQDLALVLCGRKLPAGRLRGELSDRFTEG